MKNPGVAAVLSFLVCGLGQIYNGQIGKGLLMMLAAVVSGALCLVGIGFVLLPAVWIYGIYEAYKTAEKLNQAA